LVYSSLAAAAVVVAHTGLRQCWLLQTSHRRTYLYFDLTATKENNQGSL